MHILNQLFPLNGAEQNMIKKSFLTTGESNMLRGVPGTVFHNAIGFGIDINAWHTTIEIAKRKMGIPNWQSWHTLQHM